ncbi:pantetheine-phosphate adenylyltransferase [bacterium]|nr:pantetheine-phosphate adenylyltransferase [bacterium]
MPRTAVYPGSFDPITNGHLDVVRRATRLFDRVLLAVAVNTEKIPLFSVQERVALARASVRGLRNVSVEHFEGLLVKYARRRGSSVILRGLRAVSDFESEVQLALMNRKLDGRVETVFFVPKDEYTFISSRQVKEVARLGGDVSDLVPRVVKEALLRKLGVRRSA